MKRERLEDRLLDYLYGDLSPQEAEAYEQALDDHPDLAAQVQGYRRVRAVAREVEGPAVPPQALRNVLLQAREHAVELRAAHARSRGLSGWFGRFGALLLRPAVATGFLFLIVLGTGVLLVQRSGEPDLAPRSAEWVATPAPPPPAAPAQPTTPPDEAAAAHDPPAPDAPAATTPAEPSAPAAAKKAAQPSVGEPGPVADGLTDLPQTNAAGAGEGGGQGHRRGATGLGVLGRVGKLSDDAYRRSATPSDDGDGDAAAEAPAAPRAARVAAQARTQAQKDAAPDPQPSGAGGLSRSLERTPTTPSKGAAARAQEPTRRSRGYAADEEREDRSGAKARPQARPAATGTRAGLDREGAPTGPPAWDTTMAGDTDATDRTLLNPATAKAPAREGLLSGGAAPAAEATKPAETAALVHGEPRPFPTADDPPGVTRTDGRAPSSLSLDHTRDGRTFTPPAPAAEPTVPAGGAVPARGEPERTERPLAETATEKAEQAPARAPGDELFEAANAAFTAGRYAEAATGYERYLALDRASARAATAQLRLAQAWQLQGRTRDALSVFEEILARHPARAGDPALLYQVASLQVQYGRLDAAEANLRRISGDPTWGARARDLLAVVFARRDDTGDDRGGDKARTKTGKPAAGKKTVDPAEADVERVQPAAEPPPPAE
jgi:hypothetical protein